jgi:hypothetical protein
MIQFFGKNRKTTSLLPIKPSGTQENFEDSRAELSNLELPRPSVSEISYSQIFKGLPTSASLQAPLSPQSLASLMEPSQIGSEASDLLFEEKPKSPVSIADSHLTTMTLFKQSDAFSEEGSSVTDSMRKLSFN